MKKSKTFKFNLPKWVTHNLAILVIVLFTLDIVITIYDYCNKPQVKYISKDGKILYQQTLKTGDCLIIKDFEYLTAEKESVGLTISLNNTDTAKIYGK